LHSGASFDPLAIPAVPKKKSNAPLLLLRRREDLARQPGHPAGNQSLMKLSEAIGVPFNIRERGNRQMEILGSRQLERGTGTTLPATIGPKSLLRGGSIPSRASERSNRIERQPIF